jgi:hypothetical protein
MQKKVIRAVCNANYSVHTEPLFVQLNILNVDELIIFTKGMLTHAIVHKYGPPALHNQWEFNHQRNHFQLRNDNDMYIRDMYIRDMTDYVKRMPYFSLATTWNNLPAEKMYPNHITFRISLLVLRYPLFQIR